MKIVLASASPRRAALIKSAGFSDVKIMASRTDERLVRKPGREDFVKSGLVPFKDYAERLSRLKAEDVFLKEGSLTLGADTLVVAADGEILHKPSGMTEAETHLKKLSGKTHYVITGICIINGEKTVCGSEVTEVEFYPFDGGFIADYIAGGSPFDKAGGYGLQDEQIQKYIKSVKGGADNVIGLPVGLVKRIIQGEFTDVGDEHCD